MPYRTLLAGLLAAALAPTADAAERTATLAGSSLSIDSPCAVHVAVRPDAGLSGQVVVQASADYQEELDRLVMDSRGSARIHTRPPGCWQPGPDVSFRRTLQLSVRVPSGFPVAIAETDAGRYAIGDLGAALKLDVSGAAEIEAGRTTRLDADLSGAGTMRIAAVDGPATVDVSGHGDVTIGEVASPFLDVDLSGAGSLAITSGHVQKATIGESGMGSVRIGAAVTDADVDMSGFGSVHFARVTGTFHKDVSGMGSVTVGQ